MQKIYSRCSRKRWEGQSIEGQVSTLSQCAHDS